MTEERDSITIVWQWVQPKGKAPYWLMLSDRSTDAPYHRESYPVFDTGFRVRPHVDPDSSRQSWIPFDDHGGKIVGGRGNLQFALQDADRHFRIMLNRLIDTVGYPYLAVRIPEEWRPESAPVYRSIDELETQA